MGQIPRRTNILSISQSSRCQIVTDGDHGFTEKGFVRLSNLNGMMPPPAYGMDQLNNKRFRIILSGLDSFYIQDPITFEFIDSTGFTPYVGTSGSCNFVEPNFIYYKDGDNNG